MKTFAVWFHGNKVARIEDVTDWHDDIMRGYELDGEQAATEIQKATDASAVVVAHDRSEAIAEAAKVVGLEEVGT
mgnify:CR=1 FL=1